LRVPPRLTLFPYTTLFRSSPALGFSKSPSLRISPEKLLPASVSACCHAGSRRASRSSSVCVATLLHASDLRGGSTSTLGCAPGRSEEHTSELQSRSDLVCR